MRSINTVFAAISLFASVAMAAQPVASINAKEGLAIKGYDPVAYFEEKAAVPGDAAISMSYQGVTYRFSSSSHRNAFAASPNHFLPQYGGYCSLAMSKNLIADADPTAWAIVNDKLYLNNNKVAHALWLLDKPDNIGKADKNWPSFPKYTIGN